jgi:hypothetical protein
MMPTITEGQLTFIFPDSRLASKFDDWSFYRNQFQRVCNGTKAIDVLAVEVRACFRAIEIKDYRRQPRTKAIELAEEIAEKVRDSLAALVAAQVNANDADENASARAALRCPRLRVVLYLEQPTRPAKLFPRTIDPANVQLRLRQLIKAIDPHPLVVEIANMRGVGWTVQ